jgi:hypothetical protein
MACCWPSAALCCSHGAGPMTLLPFHTGNGSVSALTPWRSSMGAVQRSTMLTFVNAGLRSGVSVVSATPLFSLADATVTINALREHGFRFLDANGIKKSILDAFEAFLIAPGTLSRPSLVIRCQVTNGDWNIRVVVDKALSRARLTDSFVPMTRRLKRLGTGRADFFVLVSDNLYVSEDRRRECLDYLEHVPFLRCDQSDDDPVSLHTVLSPDFFILDASYADDLRSIAQAVREHPFEHRIAQIKWRGSLHGAQHANDDNYHSFPRFHLLMVSRTHPNIVDARLTSYNVEKSQSGMALRRRLERLFGSPSPVLPADAFVAYKYLISTDGVGAGWRRLPTILACGSVVLMQHRWRQFFYPGLKPWVHYVPVNDDMSDLVERHSWMTAHPAEAARIAANGLSFAAHILTPAALDEYVQDIVVRCTGLYWPDA